MDLQIAQTLFQSIDSSLSSTLGSGTAKVMLGLGGVFGSAWLVQFTLSGMRWLFSGLDRAIEDILWSILRVAIVVAFAFNVAWYQRVVVPFVSNMPVWMGGILTGTEGNQTNQVDALLNKFVEVVMKVTDAMSFDVFSDFSVVAIGVCILLFLCIGGIPFLSLCIGTLVALKVSTTLMLVVGPIFIAFALFDETKRWFWGWVSVVGGFMLTNVLFSVVVALALAFINSIVLKTGTIEATWEDAFAVLFYFGAFTYLATVIPDHAATVMGGASAGSTGVKGIVGKATGLGTAARMAGGLAKRIGFKGRNRIQ